MDAIPVPRDGFFDSLFNSMAMSDTLTLTHKEILQADRDYEKAALYANLVYVSDQQPGIAREKKGHIQATGYDTRGRKQYRYHPLWNALRSETKFHRVYEFSKSLPVLREKVNADLRSRGFIRILRC